MRSIPFAELKLERALGSGSFGVGWKAVWKNAVVVVKLVSNPKAADQKR